MFIRAARSTTLVVALICTPFAASASGKPLVYGNVSGWTVLTDPEHDYRCYAQAEYEGGSFVRVGFNSADAALYLVVGGAAWEDADAGRDYELELSFDDEAARGYTGRAVSGGNGLRVVIPDGQRAAFLQDFMSRYSVSIGRGEDDPLTLSLGGSLNAVRMLEECQASMAEYQQRGAP